MVVSSPRNLVWDGVMRLSLLFVLCIALFFLTGCKKKHGEVVLSEVAASAWDDNATVSAQLQFETEGVHRAEQVRLTSVDVAGGSYAGPTALPTSSLGDLNPGHDLRFDALFKIAGANGSEHMVTVEGEYRDGGKEIHFRTQRPIYPNVAPPGPIPVTKGTTGKQNPGTAVYPTPPPSAPFGPNSEQPVFVPPGPPRQLFPPTPSGTQLGGSSGGASVQIPRNTSIRSAGVPPDPNAAAATADGVVLGSYNSNISYSKDGGKTFTDVILKSPQPGNPARTTFFPESDGGFCCDQVVIYLPNQNLFFWLLQYNPVTACATNCGPPPAANATFKITQASRLRVAWATPAALSSDFWNAWTYCDLTGPGLGTKNNEWLDYPDLAFSNTFLYVAIDHGNSTPGKVFTGRRIIARLSLADITNTAATSVGYDYAELSGSNGLNKSHMIQGAPGRLVLGSLDNGSTLRVFTLNDNENNVNASTVNISQIQQGSAYTAKAPDASDWLSVSFPGNITGGVYRNLPQFGAPSQEQYLFAFDAGVGSGRYPCLSAPRDTHARWRQLQGDRGI